VTEATLTELYDQAGGKPINLDGRTVSPVCSLEVRDGTKITVTRLTASRTRDQAAVLAIDQGVLEIDGFESSSLSLWTSTSPRAVEVYVRGDGASRLDIWNAWRGPVFEGSWLGNAGIVAQPVDGGVTLQCSDGVGPPDFTNLVIGIEIFNSGD
jgi:hypothetical protein